MWQAETCFNEGSHVAGLTLVGAEEDLVQVWNHLEGLADNEQDWDGEKE